MSEYLQMTPFILPFLLCSILLCGIWFHDVSYQHRVRGVSEKKEMTPITMIEAHEAEHDGEEVLPLQIIRQ